MKAKQLVKQRVEVHAQAFAELVIWQLPTPLAGSAHTFKYCLAYVVHGACVLRYDNEAGKKAITGIGVRLRRLTRSAPHAS